MPERITEARGFRNPEDRREGALAGMSQARGTEEGGSGHVGDVRVAGHVAPRGDVDGPPDRP